MRSEECYNNMKSRIGYKIIFNDDKILPFNGFYENVQILLNQAFHWRSSQQRFVSVVDARRCCPIRLSIECTSTFRCDCVIWQTLKFNALKDLAAFVRRHQFGKEIVFDWIWFTKLTVNHDWKYLDWDNIIYIETSIMMIIRIKNWWSCACNIIIASQIKRQAEPKSNSFKAERPMNNDGPAPLAAGKLMSTKSLVAVFDVSNKHNSVVALWSQWQRKWTWTIQFILASFG